MCILRDIVTFFSFLPRTAKMGKSAVRWPPTELPLEVMIIIIKRNNDPARLVPTHQLLKGQAGDRLPSAPAGPEQDPLIVR